MRSSLSRLPPAVSLRPLLAAVLALVSIAQAAAGSPLPPRPTSHAAGQPREAAREAYRNDRWPASRDQAEGLAAERQRWPDGANGAAPRAPVASRQVASEPDVTGTVVPHPRMGGPDMAGPAVQPHAPRATRWDVVPLPPERPW